MNMAFLLRYKGGDKIYALRPEEAVRFFEEYDKREMSKEHVPEYTKGNDAHYLSDLTKDEFLLLCSITGATPVGL